MEIGKPPIIDGAPGANPAPDVQNATVRQGVVPPPLADRTDIRPLTLPAALQILLAGMFDDWTLPLPAMMPDNPVGVAMLIVHTFLQAVPTTDAAPQVFSAVHDQLVANLEQGVDRAHAVVAAWHDVPRDAVNAVRETRVIVFAAFGEDAQNPTLGP